MTKTKIKQGLGKGLSALIPSIELENRSTKSEDYSELEYDKILLNIELDQIHSNPYQPRKDFDNEKLDDLKNSITKHGVMSPITVTKSINGFELIAGERRLRACKLAGLETIPAYVLDISEGNTKLELALIENLQREDLNPIEVAYGYRRLMEECKYTQEKVAEQVGKDRTTVTNFMRLLRLPEKIQEQVRSKILSMGHARALLGLEDHFQMISASDEIVKNALSVRAAEQLVKDIASGKKSISKNKKISSQNDTYRIIYEDVANKLRHRFSTQVKIIPKNKDTGKIELEFYSAEDLDRILEILMNSED